MRLKYKNSLSIPKESLEKSHKLLLPYIDHLKTVSQNKSYDFAESSILLPFDKHLLEDVTKVWNEKKSAKLKYIINIGIGGSSLGIKAVYDALFGQFEILEPDRFPKMIFADTNDPEFLVKLLDFINKQVKSASEFLIFMISKSGTTTETAVNFEIIFDSLKKRFAQINKQCVVITDFGSKLWDVAQKNDISSLSIPKLVGGRFSVLSSVGLAPLAFLGININNLRFGAQAMRNICLSESIEKNPALNCAITLFHYYKKGININDNFFFHPELESLGKWYRQLMGESIGKEKDINGKTVNAGITPTVSIGSTDLHSVGQLYLGGPKDKITTFVGVETTKLVKIPEKMFFEGLVDNINNKKVSDIMDAIRKGVMIAYEKKGLPFTEIILDDISEESIGAFFQFKMMEIMYLGQLLNINVFDQPNVEDYKIETRRILKN